MRLKSAIFVSALIRTANGAGAFAAVRRKGAEEAGAVFVKVSGGGQAALYGPAMQADFDESFPADRRFRCLVPPGQPEADSEARMVKEIRFDPDLWFVEIEDRDGRPFVEVIADGM